ncbi:MAG: DUF1244 domain-containing protein [Devosiaceae bacterium]|nr:DUF1244 domain-containing protein [Devosiaceae bacterium]
MKPGINALVKIDSQTQVELEAAAFRRLIAHLDDRKDAQNIDMMNLAGFCRNCLARWYQEAAGEKGLELDKGEAREIIYGMAYDEWKAKYQTEASEQQKRDFAESFKNHG